MIDLLVPRIVHPIIRHIQLIVFDEAKRFCNVACFLFHFFEDMFLSNRSLFDIEHPLLSTIFQWEMTRTSLLLSIICRACRCRLVFINFY